MNLRTRPATQARWSRHQARRTPPPHGRDAMSAQQVVSEFDADIRVLRDDEVDQVDGGIIAILIGLLVPAPPPVIHGLL